MTFNDPEFGEVIIRKSAWATNPKFSVSTSGKLTISGPKHTTVFLAKRWLNASRKQIREKLPLKDPATQRARDAQKKILAKKAKDYLPYRLDFWAEKYGYRYSGLRLSHANTRWGSRSELAHINHMDHSAEFWAEVEEHDPHYKRHRKLLKSYSPGV